ncbi:transposable element Tc3 transposase [Trichonephila clavipes]|nr:transposable element Tc3 transposase [Trichonephila clavipes]
MLGRRIAARQPPPTCLTELRRALLDEWCNILQDQIDSLILSMPKRFVLFNVQIDKTVKSNTLSHKVLRKVKAGGVRDVSRRIVAGWSIIDNWRISYKIVRVTTGGRTSKIFTVMSSVEDQIVPRISGVDQRLSNCGACPPLGGMMSLF